jgi:hypothetical protein
MPPTDNTPASTPVPTPETPKKGFFAKLFHKKEESVPAAPPRDSNTPPPQLDDPATEGADDASSVPSTDTDAVASTDTVGAPELSRPVPTIKSDADPSTLAVPSSLTAEAVEADGVKTSPSLAVQSPAAGESPAAAPSEESDEETPPTPQQ